MKPGKRKPQKYNICYQWTKFAHQRGFIRIVRSNWLWLSYHISKYLSIFRLTTYTILVLIKRTKKHKITTSPIQTTTKANLFHKFVHQFEFSLPRTSIYIILSICSLDQTKNEHTWYQGRAHVGLSIVSTLKTLRHAYINHEKQYTQRNPGYM